MSMTHSTGRSGGPDGARLRVGVVGTGGISRAHAPAWVELDAEVHAHSITGVDTYAAETGAQVHDSLDSLLAAVDLVDVTTPTPSHPEIVHAALEAGLDVICEKPLARTAAQAAAMLEHARATNRRLLPAHVVRYFPPYVAAKAAVDDGSIGTPAVLRFERTGSLPPTPWFRDENASGGIVMDQMIHDIDQAIWFAGPVTSVYAVQNISRADDGIRTAHAVLEHAGGAISHCRGLWGAPGTAFRYTFSLAGDRGKIRYDSARGTGVRFDEVARATAQSGDGFLPDVSGMRSPYVEELLEFVRAIGTGAPVRVDADDGLRAVRVAEAALESLATGRRIAC